MRDLHGQVVKYHMTLIFDKPGIYEEIITYPYKDIIDEKFPIQVIGLDYEKEIVRNFDEFQSPK